MTRTDPDGRRDIGVPFTGGPNQPVLGLGTQPEGVGVGGALGH